MPKNPRPPESPPEAPENVPVSPSNNIALEWADRIREAFRPVGVAFRQVGLGVKNSTEAAKDFNKQLDAFKPLLGESMSRAYAHDYFYNQHAGASSPFHIRGKAIQDNPVDTTEDNEAQTYIDDKGQKWSVGQHVEFVHESKSKTGRISGIRFPSYCDDIVNADDEEIHVDVWCNGSVLVLNFDEYEIKLMVLPSTAAGDDRKPGRRSIEV